ncbi:MAG: glycosyltransferase family 9 protein, partial [Terriglobales bacterium]
MKTAAILAPNWLGDAVMCLPALRALRQALPAAALTVYARPAVAPVFELADLKLWVRTLPAPAPRPRPDLAVIFPNSFHSALLALRLRARRRIGYRRDGRGWLLHPAIAPPAAGEIPSHESFYYL